MRKEQAEQLRRETEEYFRENGWKWEAVKAVQSYNKVFRYGAITLLRPTIRREA